MNPVIIYYHQIDSRTIGIELQAPGDSIHMQIPALTAPKTIQGLKEAMRKSGHQVTVLPYKERVIQ